LRRPRQGLGAVVVLTRPRFRAAGVVIIGLAVLATPLLWRAALASWGPPRDAEPASYLPALEASRARQPFNPDPIDDLRRMAPGYVIVGDSMAGRVDPSRLVALTNQMVAPILQNATGSAYWYLVFKNYVVESGVRPKRTVIFFRDTNLTEPLFRLEGPYRPTVDQVAHDREDELNAVVAARMTGPWFRVHRLVDRAYDIDRARTWLEPRLTLWAAGVAAGTGRREAFVDSVNATFALDRLRPMAQADLAAASDREADFAANVSTSVLPLIVTLAHERDLPLCFVRVLRRPVNGQPPPESPALQRYVADLAAYLGAHGAAFLDDRDDPALSGLAYSDGDHIAGEERPHYTALFAAKLARLDR
jgi:hypothetical protein